MPEKAAADALHVAAAALAGVRFFREFSGSQYSVCKFWPALPVTQERPVRDFAASMPRRFIAWVVIPMDAFET